MHSHNHSHEHVNCCANHSHVHGTQNPAVNVPGGAIFTCPMHPQIRQGGPGSCPLCGMALEPEMPSAAETQNPEYMDMKRRFWFGLVFTLPVFALEMGAHMNGPIFAFSNIIQMILATPVVLWAGWPFFVRGVASIRSRHLNMFTLIAMGTGIAWAYSVVAALAPGIFPEGFRRGGQIAVYFESAAVITVLALLGQVLELRAREKTGGALRALLNLSPKTARLVGADGTESDVPLEAVKPGDIVRVRPGESVPVDGIVTEGKTTLDESMLTGESMPVAKAPGDFVTGGTLNGTGSILMRAQRVGNETTLARIVQLVAEAQRSRAPVQRLVDSVTGWFVPVVIITAIAAFILWYVFGPQPSFSHALVAAVSVLIIACPCALGLATPMSIMVGVGRGARAGLLIRNAEALERMEGVDTLILDKTGTLTAGKPEITAICSITMPEDEILTLAAALEQASEHPLAHAVVTAARARGLTLQKVENFNAVTGKGITGHVSGRAVVLGNAALMQDCGVAITPLAAEAETHRAQGAIVIFVAIDGVAAGFIAIADPIRATTPPALEMLRRAGIRIIMATGDNATTAHAVARQLGIDDVLADTSPEEKAIFIRELQANGHRIAMVGDGTNDAPALATADIGIAMGTGTDVALQGAGITLLHADLMGIARARKLSRAVMRNIRQNLFFAFVYNAAGVPLAAGILYPAFGLTLSPTIAAAAMALSSVSVIGNALRLRGGGL